MQQLVESVSKKPLPAHTKYLVFEFCATDASDEDVEVRGVLPLGVHGCLLVLIDVYSCCRRCRTCATRSKKCVQWGNGRCFVFLSVRDE